MRSDAARSRQLVPLEEQDQIALVAWFDLAYPALRGRLAASSAGARMRPRTAKRQKAAGMRAGFPDLCLLTPRKGFSGLIIELKRLKGGHLEPEQADWLEWLARQGFMAVICKGFEAAKATIEDYLREEQGGENA
ncbi:VRR-NUC domain-containing protein [Pseudomonas schmalbachii]|uniref:VRR-NUC domain-containing protein n=1 Tax=Pseudomonas schmalbachii TaxID=2816993 RepID=A0ABS3TKH9_9PSED|nr:VRR-NUC domain-containing protein [Pseudomonas schmalbachii]MBO3274143.1 VRR-NUC domain-containing protein [Pseudomonas schmalbachii]